MVQPLWRTIQKFLKKLKIELPCNPAITLPYTFCPTHVQLPLINIPSHSGTFVTTDEPTPIHHSLTKSTVYMRFHSWCCTFYGFRRMYNNTFSSVTQSCPTLCSPMNRSMPGLPVHHQLPEFTQTHVHPVGDAIQPSHPLSSPSPPAPNPSQHQGLLQ